MMWIKVRLYSLIKEKKTITAIWKLLYTATGFSSSIFAFIELLMVGMVGLADLCKDYWWMIIFLGVLAAFVCNREKTTLKKTVKETQIEVQINNLFNIKADSYVIPTNTFFRTNMEDEYISPKSVQGGFQLKYYNNKLTELDLLIAQSLEKQEVKGTDSRDKFGSVKKYPIGTVAKVDCNGKHYYFMAINDVNSFGKPVGQEYKNIDIALSGLINTIQTIGHFDELAIPLIGTGKAAIKNAYRENVVKDIVNKFADDPSRIVKKLIVCIRPEDYIEGTVKIGKVEKYLNYKCEFSDS